MLAQAEGTAEDCDLGLPGTARERRRHHNGRGHQAVGILMMLIDGDAVEAELGCKLQLVEIAVIELVALLRVEMGVRQNHPGGAIFPRSSEVEIGIRHEVKEKDLHDATLRMN